MKFFYIAAIAIGLISMSGCSRGSASTTGEGRPSVLRYAYGVTSEDVDAAAQRLEGFQRYMEGALHVHFEIVRTTGYGSVIEAFRAHKVDMASISPFSYVLASAKTPIEAIVMRGNGAGGAGEYGGALAVPGNSPIHSVDDLVRHSKELTISFVDPASASGFLLQNVFLQSKGLEPERDFRKVVFTMNHIASIMTLKAGKVDLAAVQPRLVDRYLQTGKLSPGDVRIIWMSPKIPNQPTAVRKDLPASFKEEIRRAFMEMHVKAPAVFAAMRPKAYAGIAGGLNPYSAADDAMFDGLRQMARSVPNLSLLDR